MITFDLKILDLKNWTLVSMNKITIILLIFFLSYAQVVADPLVNARTAIIVDYHSDKILYELEADAQIYPASMTKIMTTIVAFDLIKKNRISLDDKFVVSENAWRLSKVVIPQCLLW